MNFGEMKQQARYLLGDGSTSTYFETDDVELAINNAAIQVARATLSLMTYQDFATIDADDGTLPPDDPRRDGRYPLPYDFLSLKDVQIIDGTNRYQLDDITYDQFESLAISRTKGRPEYYRAEFGSTSNDSLAPGDIWFWPLPDRAYTGRAVYYQKPTKMVLDDDICELAEAMHMTVVYYASMLLCMRDDDSRRMDKFAALYSEALGNDEQLVARMNRVGPKGIQPAYGLGGIRRGRRGFRDR